MPITQDRMLALIRAGYELDEAMQTMKELADRQCRAAQAGKISWQEAASEIAFQFSSMPTGDALRVLDREGAWFRAKMKYNEAAKRQQERRRRRIGVVARPLEDHALRDPKYAPQPGLQHKPVNQQSDWNEQSLAQRRVGNDKTDYENVSLESEYQEVLEKIRGKNKEPAKHEEVVLSPDCLAPEPGELAAGEPAAGESEFSGTTESPGITLNPEDDPEYESPEERELREQWERGDGE